MTCEEQTFKKIADRAIKLSGCISLLPSLVKCQLLLIIITYWYTLISDDSHVLIVWWYNIGKGPEDITGTPED